MLLPNQLTSGGSTDILTIELDSNSFNLFQTEPSESITIQPDLSGILAGNPNSLGNHWFHHLDGPGYRYINLDGTRYYQYSDLSSVFCSPRDGGLVRYKSPSGVIEKEVKGEGSILLVIKRSNAGLMLHVYSPLPMGKSQNDIYMEYVHKSNQNL